MNNIGGSNVLYEYTVSNMNISTYISLLRTEIAIYVFSGVKDGSLLYDLYFKNIEFQKV